MSDRIFEPDYWAERLKVAQGRGELWKSVYECHRERFDMIADLHRSIIQYQTKPTDSVLDIGCGYGRLLDLMPSNWTGEYVGIDLSPDLLAVARRHYPNRTFLQMDVRNLVDLRKKYDVAILLSVKGMICRIKGNKEWDAIEQAIDRVANSKLILEFGDLEWKDE